MCKIPIFVVPSSVDQEHIGPFLLSDWSRAPRDSLSGYISNILDFAHHCSLIKKVKNDN